MSDPIASKAALDLLDWKRSIFDLYRDVRATDAASAWDRWRETRDRLFASHAQSPIPASDRAGFQGLAYFEYDPNLRVAGTVRDAQPEVYEIPTSGNSVMRFTRFATCSFTLGGDDLDLELYWLEAYGGGIFLPFRDATSDTETYGAGRYLLDTVKGADLGTEDDDLVLDFNFAYNPSCAYDPRWVCPLAPPPNRLEVPIRAGEKIPAGPTGTN